MTLLNPMQFGPCKGHWCPTNVYHNVLCPVCCLFWLSRLKGLLSYLCVCLCSMYFLVGLTIHINHVCLSGNQQFESKIVYSGTLASTSFHCSFNSLTWWYKFIPPNFSLQVDKTFVCLFVFDVFLCRIGPVHINHVCWSGTYPIKSYIINSGTLATTKFHCPFNSLM